MKKTIFTFLIINSAFFTASAQQAGDLDLTFGTDGKQITDFALASGGRSVAIQKDGKIVMVGMAHNGSNDDFAVVRYKSNGSLDSTFSGDGKLTTSIGSYSDEGYSVAIQVDGKIVVAGSSHNGINYDFAVVRYNSDGTLDNTFSGDGKLTTDIGSKDNQGYSVSIQLDGKILVAGDSYTGINISNFALIRYNSDGSLDNTFSGDGKQTTAIGSGIDKGNSVSIQPDGKIVVVGSSDNGKKIDFALVR